MYATFVSPTDQSADCLVLDTSVHYDNKNMKKIKDVISYSKIFSPFSAPLGIKREYAYIPTYIVCMYFVYK